jgi:hypothetical protein
MASALRTEQRNNSAGHADGIAGCLQTGFSSTDQAVRAAFGETQRED